MSNYCIRRGTISFTLGSDTLNRLSLPWILIRTHALAGIVNHEAVICKSCIIYKIYDFRPFSLHRSLVTFIDGIFSFQCEGQNTQACKRTLSLRRNILQSASRPLLKSNTSQSDSRHTSSKADHRFTCSCTITEFYTLSTA